MVTLATFAFAACGGDDDDDTTDGSDVTLSTEVDGTTPTEDTATDDTTVDDTTDGTTSSSDSGEVGSQEEYIEATKSEVSFEDTDLNDCVAEAVVSDEVYAAIQDAGLTVEAYQSEGPDGLDLDEAAAQVMADDLAACGDLVGQVLAGADDVQLACAEEHISNQQIAEFLAFSLLGLEPSSDVTDANDAVDECIAAASTTTTG